MVEQFDLGSMGCNTADSIHMMVEAKKLAFIARAAYMADPDHTDIPTQGLISKEYARERAKLIDSDTVANPNHGDPWVFQSRHALKISAA